MSDWILDEKGNAVPGPDLMKWARWYGTVERHVGNDTLPNGVHVSTVFLGLDHNFSGIGRPILWETMIFGGEHDQYQERYTTREEAIAGHEVALNLAKGVQAEKAEA